MYCLGICCNDFSRRAQTPNGLCHNRLPPNTYPAYHPLSKSARQNYPWPQKPRQTANYQQLPYSTQIEQIRGGTTVEQITVLWGKGGVHMSRLSNGDGRLLHILPGKYVYRYVKAYGVGTYLVVTSFPFPFLSFISSPVDPRYGYTQMNRTRRYSQRAQRPPAHPRGVGSHDVHRLRKERDEGCGSPACPWLGMQSMYTTYAFICMIDATSFFCAAARQPT